MVEVIDVFLGEGHFYFPVLVEVNQGLVGNFLSLVFGLGALASSLLLVLPVS
jgi:hypothetical protein